jgi:hypothetical protein
MHYINHKECAQKYALNFSQNNYLIAGYYEIAFGATNMNLKNTIFCH